MRKAKSLFAILIVGLFLSSCASVNLRPLSSGEARLTYMEMPDIVREDLPYEVILTFESEERPEIKKICFRWVAEQNPSASPSLHNYSMGADFSKDINHSGWLPTGVAVGSEMFCAETESIRVDVPGKIIVKIRPANLRSNYNKLEGQAEYISDGRLRTTNKISTRVLVER